MSSKVDSRQIKNVAALDQLAGANVTLDSLNSAINTELKMPLRMKASSTPNLVLNIDAISVASPVTGRTRTIPPISSLIPNWTSGTVTLGSTGAGSATPSAGVALALGMTASQFLRVGVSIDATGSLTLTKGTAASSLAAATIPPTVSGLFAIGHFVARTDASNNTQTVQNSDIYQYVGGGGGSSGSGNASSLLESIKNQLVDSPFRYVTPNIISTDGQAKFATLTGSTYDVATNTIKFSANAQVALSSQMLDPMFLADALDVGSVDLSLFWNKGSSIQTFAVPTAFTYEVSRDGGTNWFAVTMSQVGTTEAFRGSLVFDGTSTTESTKQNISAQATQDANRVLNASSQQAISQAFTLSATTKLQEVVLSIAKAGSPSGNLYVSIIKDSSGSPSTAAADVYTQSNAVAVSGIAAGPANVTVDIPDVVLVAGTYHIVISTDASYKSSFVSTTTELRIREKQTSPSTPFTKIFDGSSYTTPGTTGDLTYQINGRALDLRVRVTSAGSPTYPCGLDGYGIFYNLQDVGFVNNPKRTQRFTFNSVTDNTSTFAITAFTPDPDLMTCYWVEGGQAFKYPAFTLNGNSAVFPTNTFNNNGISQTVTLIFDQNSGGAIDTSDSNSRLMATNHLGSSSGADDKSAAGRGIILRRPDGTLREIALDNNDNIIILSVP